MSPILGVESTSRPFFIILTFIISTLGAQIVIYMFFKSWLSRKKAKTTSSVFFAYGILVSGYILGYTCLMVHRTWDLGMVNDIIYSFTWIFISLGLMGYHGIIEHEKKKKGKIPYFFVGVSALVLPFAIFRVYFLAGILVITSVLGQFIFHLKLYRGADRSTKRDFRRLFIGNIFIWISILPFANLGMQFIESENILLFFLVLLFIGEILSAIGFVGIEVIEVDDWKKDLLALYIIGNNKTTMQELLFFHDFGNDSAFRKPNLLISGGILGIESVLLNFGTFETKISVVEQENSAILIYNQKNFIICLIVQHLQSIHRKILIKLAERFQKIYRSVLISFNTSMGKIEDIFDGFSSEIAEILKRI